MRNIEDILHFRSDLSPFLVHLTKSAEGKSASDNLKKILDAKKMICGNSLISDVRFGGKTIGMNEDDKKAYFSAICFTETPLSEIHCLLEIADRRVDLEPYGIVFLKNALTNKGVSPVIYINNLLGDKTTLFEELFSLTEEKPDLAQELLPLVSLFGKKITPPGATRQTGDIDFLWEREWRFPSCKGDLDFADNDIFVGLCPEDEINEFEQRYSPIEFVDPKCNIKWWAKKLIDARQRLDIQFSVV